MTIVMDSRARVANVDALFSVQWHLLPSKAFILEIQHEVVGCQIDAVL